MTGRHPRDKTFTILGLLLLCSLSLAATSEGQAGFHFDWGRFFSQVLNSTLLFGGLIFLLRKQISNFLFQGSVQIRDDIIDREKELQTTSQDLEAIKTRLLEIEAEVRQIRADARAIGQEEKQKLEEAGKKEAGRIYHINEVEIRGKVEAELRRLKEKIADMTIENFKKDFAGELDERLHAHIIQRNIDIIGDIVER